MKYQETTEYLAREFTGIAHEPFRGADSTELQGFNCQDFMDISSGRLELSQLVAQARVTKDVRMDRVNAIRRQLASGSYRVDADSVADRLIDSMLERQT